MAKFRTGLDPKLEKKLMQARRIETMISIDSRDPMTRKSQTLQQQNMSTESSKEREDVNNRRKTLGANSTLQLTRHRATAQTDIGIHTKHERTPGIHTITRIPQHHSMSDLPPLTPSRPNLANDDSEIALNSPIVEEFKK